MEKSPYGEELEQKFECIKERIFLVDHNPQIFRMGGGRLEFASSPPYWIYIFA